GSSTPSNCRRKSATDVARLDRNGPAAQSRPMPVAHCSAAHAGNAVPAADPLDRLLAEGRPLVMGVLNVTPDSFSDGGKFIEPDRAVAQAGRMAAEGADILDVGGESTRPYAGATPVSVEEELDRLVPILPRLVALGRPVSIDTMKAAV